MRAARKYDAILRAFFGQENVGLDLVLLGLGENAHTASLFPHTAILLEKDRWVGAVYIPELQMDRVTLTAPFINQSQQVIFLVSGRGKANALQDVLEGDTNPIGLPAQLIKPKSGNILWLIDKAAATSLANVTDAISQQELAD